MSRAQWASVVSKAAIGVVTVLGCGNAYALSGFVMSGSVCAEPAEGAASARGANQVHRDPELDLLFTYGMGADQRAQTTLRAGDLIVQKTVSSSGEAELRISDGHDAIEISTSAETVAVRRQKQVHRFNARAATDKDLVQVRRVLLGSSATRSFRMLLDALERTQQDDGFRLMTLTDAAYVAMLDGDSGAIQRVAARAAARRTRPVQNVGYRAARVQFPDCVSMYQSSVMTAAYTFFNCVNDAREAPWYLRGLLIWMCENEWYWRAEAAAFQFISCMAFSGVPSPGN